MVGRNNFLHYGPRQRKLALWLTLLLALPVEARDLRPELSVEGRVDEISLSPSGDLWFGSSFGRAHRSEDGGRSWYEVKVTSRQMRLPDVLFGDELDRVTFFDGRRAIFSGYIGASHDQIFRTEDGGATWVAVQIPVGMWVYDAQATSDGHAWLAGSNGAVLHSSDYGSTWEVLTRPFKETSERTMRVWFTSPDAGMVGSLFRGELAITRDGGKTWTPFEAAGREAIISGCPEARDLRVTQLRTAGDRVIVQQCGAVFASPLAEPRKWTRLYAAGSPLTHFELYGENAIVGLTVEGHIVEITAGGTERLLAMYGNRAPVALAVSGKRIALLDSTLRLTAFDGESWLTTRMFGKGVATSWPIRAIDREKNDVLWGISTHFLYRSDDAAKTWDRIAELPGAHGIDIQSDGNILLSGDQWVGRWDAAAGRLAEVPVLQGLDVAGSFRRPDLWILHGGREAGFVAASTDGGRTWSIVDRWDEVPVASFLSDDNRLTLLSMEGSIRQGTIAREPLAANMQTLLRGEHDPRAPRVEGANVLDFLDPRRGWIVGPVHHMGTVVFRTSDGGRSWKWADVKAYPRTTLHRLFDGTWIGVVLPSTLQRRTGKTFETLVNVPGEIAKTWVDAQGSLMVQLGDRSLHVLDVKQKALRPLQRSR